MSKSLGFNKRIAIVLFNLGGPDNLESVKPFLFSLFYDKKIINLPNPFRYVIAKIISITRNKKSQKIYSLIGNKSPLLKETEAQKSALSRKLKESLKEDYNIFIIMRHSFPKAAEVIDKIREYDPSEIILLPLYPQFSSTTTGSAIENFYANGKSLSHIPIKTVCCYPIQEEFINSHVLLIKESIKKLKEKKNFRILFSAHGLPIKIIKAGDPYQWQIEQSVKSIVRELNIDNLDYKITYQSRVGPVEWLTPNTEDEIERAGKEGKNLIIVPIAFVSEHVETLVELDMEYKLISDKYNIEYIRVPALGISQIFIDSLAKMILYLVNQKYDEQVNNLIANTSERKFCPNNFSMCLYKKIS